MSNEGWQTAFKDLMPFVVASTMMETIKNLEWRWQLADHLNAVFLIAMLPVADGLVRGLLELEVEKKGLRPLTDQNQLVPRQEIETGAKLMPWLDVFNRMCLEAVEREIIRLFAWRGK